MEKLGCCQCCSQQPLNEPSTVSVSHMVLRATACLPACLPDRPAVSGTFALRPLLVLEGPFPFNANRCREDATRSSRHGDTDNGSSMCLQQGGENHHDATSFNPHRYARHRFPLFSLFLFMYRSLKCLEQRLARTQRHLKIFKPTK